MTWKRDKWGDLPLSRLDISVKNRYDESVVYSYNEN